MEAERDLGREGARAAERFDFDVERFARRVDLIEIKVSLSLRAQEPHG